MITSSDLRQEFKRWNTWRNKVSRNALLKDTAFYTPPLRDLNIMVARWSRWIQTENIKHTGNSGRFDCDNFAGLCCNFIKLWHHQRAEGNEEEYCIFPCALEENHTICLCMTTEGLFFIEPQNGEIWNISDHNSKVIMVG